MRTYKKIEFSRRVALVSSILLAVVSCGSVPQAKIEPPSQDVIWRNGIAFSQQMNDDIKAQLGYEQTTIEGHIFQLGIINGSDDVLQIEPSAIHCQLVGENGAIERQVQITNPEDKVEQSRRELQQYSDQPAALLMLDALVTVGDMVLDIADAVSPPQTEEESQQRAERQKQKEQRRRQDEERQLRIKELERSYNVLSNVLLRRHTLMPGEAVSGKIICPDIVRGINEPGGFQVTIPLRNNNFTFKFAVTFSST